MRIIVETKHIIMNLISQDKMSKKPTGCAQYELYIRSDCPAHIKYLVSDPILNIWYLTQD